MRQQTLDGFDFQVESTLKILEKPDPEQKIDWTLICLNPRTKKGESLTAYFARHLVAGYLPVEIKEKLQTEMLERGIKWTYEHERRFDIHMGARPSEHKTHILPIKKELMKRILQIVR